MRERISWARSIPLPASAIFQIGALLCFIRRAKAPRRNLAAALALFAAALLSHEGSAVFPAIVVAYAFLLEAPREQRLWPNFRAVIEWAERGAIAAAPFVGVVVAYLALRLWVLGAIAPISPKNDWTAAKWILTIPEALAQFLLLLTLPWRAGPAHELRPADSVLVADFYLPMLGLVAAATVLWLFFRRYPHHRLYLFCAVWVVIALAPVLNLRTLAPVETIQDRFLYMPSVAWCLFLADFAAGFIAAGGVRARVAASAAAALALIYGVYLWRTGHLRSAERELEIAAGLRPRDGITLADLGSLHMKMGKLDRARGELEREISVWRDAPTAAYLDLAEVSARLGDRKTSEQMLQHAGSMPGGQLAAARVGAKLAISVYQDYTVAEKGLEQIPAAERDVEIWALLAWLARKQGRLDDALADYESALRLAPKRTDLLVHHAGVLYRLGRVDESPAEVNLALTVHPHDAQLQRLADLLQKRANPR
jgi:tetratricopeptide (TPR) repeat protein